LQALFWSVGCYGWWGWVPFLILAAIETKHGWSQLPTHGKMWRCLGLSLAVLVNLYWLDMALDLFSWILD
jgi:hypothetical protein